MHDTLDTGHWAVRRTGGARYIQTVNLGILNFSFALFLKLPEHPALTSIAGPGRVSPLCSEHCTGIVHTSQCAALRVKCANINGE